MQGTGGGFLSALAISGMDVQSRPSWKRRLHLLITLKKSWTWTLGKGPWCLLPAGPRVGQEGGFERQKRRRRMGPWIILGHTTSLAS